MKPEGWEQTETMLSKQFDCNTFQGSLDFIAKVAEIAEQVGHHPDIHIYYSVVQIDTWTHDTGGITEKDFELAQKIETIQQ